MVPMLPTPASSTILTAASSHLSISVLYPIRYIEYDMTDAIIFPLEEAWLPVKPEGMSPIKRSFLMYRYKNTSALISCIPAKTDTRLNKNAAAHTIPIPAIFILSSP